MSGDDTDMGDTDLGDTDMGDTDMGDTDLGDTDLGDTELGSDAHPRFSERRALVEDWTRRRRNRKLLVVGGLLLLVVLLAAATQSALLDIDEVRVVGAQGLAPAEVRQAAGVGLGTPVLGLDTDAVERRVRSLPKVRTVAATTSWRGVLTVEIVERLPIARIETPEGVMVVADDGMVIDLIEPPSPDQNDVEPPGSVAELPLISGAMFSRDVGDLVPTVLEDAVAIAAALPSDIREVTNEVEITVDSLVLRAVGGGRISVGDARDLEEKFTTIRAFLAQVDLSCLEILNVRAPAVPVITRNPNC